jgi:hypothetical protein
MIKSMEKLSQQRKSTVPSSSSAPQEGEVKPETQSEGKPEPSNRLAVLAAR